jgi:phenylpropionate dioxygenase-like ring-hydroxylating dioxygenase large terminal subunit
MPHVPFVHRRTIGRRLRGTLRRDSVMRIRLEETALGFRIHSAVDGVTLDGSLEWRRPNGMVLWLMKGAPPGRGFRQHVFCVPIDDDKTRMFVISTRTFFRYNPLGWLSDQLNRMILTEDRAIVESSQPRLVPPAVEEQSSATDGPTLHFRRWYFRTLAVPPAAGLVPAQRLRAARAGSVEERRSHGVESST